MALLVVIPPYSNPPPLIPRNRVEAAINSLPNPGDPEAAESFAKAEGVLNTAKRYLGDELYDQFRITLDDMKPEYVG